MPRRLPRWAPGAVVLALLLGAGLAAAGAELPAPAPATSVEPAPLPSSTPAQTIRAALSQALASEDASVQGLRRDLIALRLHPPGPPAAERRQLPE